MTSRYNSNLGTVVVSSAEARSYWQPLPSCGYVTVAITPEEAPFDDFSCGTQVLPPGRYVREHAHARNHELIYVCEGAGTLTVDGVTRPVCAATRYSSVASARTGSTASAPAT
jgi:oxalate decarboxylase/phosphoglucose isomerase-like protein (cupin superfamily)